MAQRRGEILKLLLVYGVDVNLRTAYGQTPLELAEADGNKGIVKLLIQNGANHAPRKEMER